MIVRFFGLLAMLGIAWLLRRAVRARPGVGSRTAQPPPPQAGGRMVRDRVCNTFLPRSKALVEQVGGQEHFFCSEPCRRSFLARTDGVSA